MPCSTSQGTVICTLQSDERAVIHVALELGTWSLGVLFFVISRAVYVTPSADAGGTGGVFSLIRFVALLGAANNHSLYRSP